MPPEPRPQQEGRAAQAGSVPQEAVAQAGPLRPPRRIWDLALTIVLILAAAAATLGLSFVGLFFGLAGDACMGSNVCRPGWIEAGVLLAGFGVWLPFLAALIVAVVRLVRRRLAFWVPVVGLALSFSCTLLGAWLAGVGSGS